MGRPRELSPEERADLLRRGYRPVEIWVPDLDPEGLRVRLQEEAKRIAAADDEDDMMDWIAGVAPFDENDS